MEASGSECAESWDESARGGGRVHSAALGPEYRGDAPTRCAIKLSEDNA